MGTEPQWYAEQMQREASLEAYDPDEDDPLEGVPQINPDGKPCGYCGTWQNEPRVHSGYVECGKCWNWRKLNGPAARYWVAAIDRLFYDPETGSSGPDLNDLHHWEKWDLTDEMTYALMLLQDVRDRYQEEINAEKQRREDAITQNTE